MSLTWIEIRVVVDIPFVVAAHETTGEVYRLSIDGKASRALAHSEKRSDFVKDRIKREKYRKNDFFFWILDDKGFRCD